MIPKKSFLIVFILLTLFFLVNCGKGESPVSPDEEQTEQTDDEETEENPILSLEEERAISMETLTSGSSKTWSFEKVILKNANGSFDISQNFNVKEDFFIFSTSAQNGKNSRHIEWRKENDININAASIEEALLEHLISPGIGSFEFLENSSYELSSQELGVSLELTSTGKLSGTIDVGTGISLDVVLVEINSSNNAIPTETLNFTELFSFESNGIDNQSPDIIGSFVSNSLYVALREDDLFDSGPVENPERIIRFDLETSEIEERVYALINTSDFVSKELVIYKNELKVIGAQRINSYDLELENEPISTVDYNETSPYPSTFFTRYGSVVLDDSVYIFGGFLGSDFQYADRVFKFNLETEVILDIATLPEPSLGARSEIVGNKIYSFGGSTEFYSPQARNTIIVYDIASQEISFSEMNRAVNFTFTGKHGNLIYVGGRVDTYNEIEELIDRDPFLGVFNTVTNEFIELSTNLLSPNKETIHAMTVFNGKIYLLFGDRTEIARPEMVEWKVLSADI